MSKKVHGKDTVGNSKAAMAAKKQFLQHLLLILQFTLSRSLNIISTNNTFKEGDLLISKGNRFALGFFSPGKSSNRYLGIWFHEVKEPHAVWVANRNYPISGFSGVLSINQYGNLVLYDGLDQKVPLWSSNVTGKVADSCVAQLLDSGNLVLLEEKSKRIVWQSFDYPTDTLLHGMRLGLNTKTGLEWVMTSWRSKDDPATGDYSVRIDPRTTPQLFLYKGSIPIWRTFLWPWKIFANIYDYYYVNNAEETYFVHLVKDASAILRVIVDNSGLIKWLRWHENDGQWKEFWYVPKYPCDFYALCGAYGKCSHSIPGVYECSCLPGYKPRFPRDWDLRDSSGGCVRKQAEPSLLCRHGEGFVKVGHVKFPDTSATARVRFNVSHAECEQECLRNCSCNAYASINNGRSECLTWYGELTDSLDYVDEDYDMYVRVDAAELAEDNSKSHIFHNKKLHILIPSVTLAWTTISLLAYLWIRRRKGVTKNQRRNRLFDPAHGSVFHKNTLTAAELRQNNHPPNAEFFDLRIIVDATNNFSTSNTLGQGGFGSVYKGQLPDGQEVAVKRLSKNSGQGIEEFKNEVMLIAKLQHRNLVKLLGYCIEGGERILIYEYLPNKSLDSFLFDQTRRTQMDWTKRLKIITEIARGILYLHHDSRLRIIHRDLKCGNILLDEEMHPKIADFGTARIFAANQIQEKTSRVIGTYGYMSPEYALFGKFSMKSDVFSYGIILLEIISGRKSNEYYEEGSSLSLIGHVWELWRQNKVMEIVDSSMGESFSRDEALRCIQIGLLCVQENAEDRPTMLEVVLMLASEKSLPYPNQPAFIFRKPANISSSAEAEADGQASSSINELTITDLLTR